MQEFSKCPGEEIITLTIQRLDRDVNEVRQDLKNTQTELYSRFDRLDSAAQDMRVMQVRVEERLHSIEDTLSVVETQSGESKKFRRKVILSILGGALSFGTYVIQHNFFN